jgi:hypothetical protein
VTNRGFPAQLLPAHFCQLITFPVALVQAAAALSIIAMSGSPAPPVRSVLLIW